MIKQPRSICLVTMALLAWSVRSVAQDPSWPAIAGRIGPYSGVRTLEDVAAATRDGFNITVQSAYDPAVLKAMTQQGMKYIDIQLWSLLYAQCKRQFDAEAAAGARRSCNLSSQSRTDILHEAEKHIRQVGANADVVAFWILDDYPAGDVSGLLEDLRALVQRSGDETGTRRPVICGVGGSLDHRSERDPAIRPDRTYIEAALVNLTPSACDIVAPYFYGAAVRDDPRWIDWSMADLMPWFMNKLRDRGFDRPALLPVVQAFYAGKRGGTTYYVQPGARDIEAQARAYCRQGALAMMFFTWQASDAERSYSNDPDIRAGVAAAVNACRSLGLGQAR